MLHLLIRLYNIHTHMPDIVAYSKLKLLRVDRIDLQETTNNASHHTDVYDLSGETNFDEPRPAQLIVRRGQPFYIDLHLQRSFASEVDDVNVVFEIGESSTEKNDWL